MEKPQKSIYTKLGCLIKKITGIKDISLLRKSLKYKIGRVIYHKKYNEQDISLILQEMGVTKGSVVCIHSSMKEFYNYTGTASDLIKAIMNVISEEGTLIMPAFPKNNLREKKDYIFDSLNDPTGAGYLAETFRKFPNVKRSINIQHSVCAWGKHAEWLIKDHHLCHDCWDENSPWQRMITLNAIVLNLGLPRSFMGTFHHCVESVLQYEHPYWAQFFNVEEEYKYYDEKHNVSSYTAWTSKLDRRTKKKKVTKYFTNEDWCIRSISNLEIKAFYTNKCFPKMLQLGRKGISVYYVPSPKKYKF